MHDSFTYLLDYMTAILKWPGSHFVKWLPWPSESKSEVAQYPNCFKICFFYSCAKFGAFITKCTIDKLCGPIRFPVMISITVPMPLDKAALWSLKIIKQVFSLIFVWIYVNVSSYRKLFKKYFVHVQCYVAWKWSTCAKKCTKLHNCNGVMVVQLYYKQLKFLK